MQKNTFDQELNAVVAVYKGFLRADEFKEIALESLELIRKTGSSKILVNTGKFKIMVKENQEWLNNTWFPEAKKLGVKFMAFIVPDDYFGKMSVETVNKPTAEEGTIQIDYFYNESAARRWLKNNN